MDYSSSYSATPGDTHLIALSATRIMSILRGITPRNVEHKYTDGRYEIDRLDPTSFTSGLVTSTATHFRLKPNFTGHIDMAILELDFAETGGANSVTPIPAPWMIDRIEIKGNGTNDVLQTINDRELFASLNFLSDEQIRSYFSDNQLNLDPDTFVLPTSGAQVIPASGSKTYAIPLLTSLLNQINPDYIKFDMIIEVYLKPNPVSTGTGVLEITGMRLQLHHYNDTRERSIQRSSPPTRSSPFKIFYTDEQTHLENLQLKAGAQSEILLNGLNGTFAGFAVFARPATYGIAGSTLGTLSDIAGDSTDPTYNRSQGLIDLTDHSRTSLIGSGPNTCALLQGALNAFHGGGALATTVPIYFIVAAADMKQAVRKGRHTGHFKSAGDLYLRITPGATWTDGSYEVSVVGFRYSGAIMGNGIIRRLL